MRISRIRLSDKTSCLRPRQALRSHRQAHERQALVEILRRVALVSPAAMPMLATEPLAQPPAGVGVKRTIGFAHRTQAEVVGPADELAIERGDQVGGLVVKMPSFGQRPDRVDHEFRNGRQFAAWLGMVPRQYSTGGKQRLGRITKAGDAYLRTPLIMGARAVLASAAGRTGRISRWALALQARRGYMRAVVAVAAKNARLAWARLRAGEDFRLREVAAA